jgi:uncharacterized membrane protein
MLDQAIAEIAQHLSGWFHGWFDPIRDWLFVAEWWALLLAFIALCLLIGYFAQFRSVRAVLGILILIASAFVAGGTEMYRHIKKNSQ